MRAADDRTFDQRAGMQHHRNLAKLAIGMAFAALALVVLASMVSA